MNSSVRGQQNGKTGRSIALGFLVSGWLGASATLFAGGSRPLWAQSVPAATKGAPRAQRDAGAAEQKGVSGEPGDDVGSAQAINGAAPGQKTAPKPVTAAHLLRLPEPLPKSLTQGIDVAGESKRVLDHLSEVIRFYRMMTTPIQKTGEPSDVLYAEQAQSTATQVTQLAFQSARDEAALLVRVQVMPGMAPAQAPEGSAQKMLAAQQRIMQQMQALQDQMQSLDQQLKTARGKERSALEDQKTQIEGQLGLLVAAEEALRKVSGISSLQSNSGLQADIDKLQHSVPEVVDNKVKPVANTLDSLGSMRDAGVLTQAQVLFGLLTTEHAIDQRSQEVDRLHKQADSLRAPLLNILRATLQEGQKLQQSSASGDTGQNSDPASIRKQYDELTDAFKTISGVSVPISQEVLLLEQTKGNLISWRAAVDSERATIVHSLLLRVVIIALALLVVLGLGEAWRRGVTKYVGDLRRRRQLLVVRRMVIGFLSGVVILLGFVTQFSSLATFAGFISAGIAVGLQTVLLSVAAYFFIVGRYGVRVGDRITVAGVTGEVVEVGLVRFYLMELAGAGAEMHPTGRIAVFANSVLFQTGTPLYKQIPGSNYVWHEVVTKLKPGANHVAATAAVRAAVDSVYDTYKGTIEQEHAATEGWMDTSLPRPRVESRLQLSDGLQFSVLFPVQLSRAVDTDQAVIEKVLTAVENEPAAREAIDGPPVLRAVVKA